MDPPNRSRSNSAVNLHNQSHSNSPAPGSDANVLLNTSAAFGLLDQPVNFNDPSFTNHYPPNSQRGLFDGSFGFGANSQDINQQSNLLQPPLYDQSQLAQSQSLGNNQFTSDASLFSDFTTLNSQSSLNVGLDPPLFPSSDFTNNLLGGDSLDSHLLDQSNSVHNAGGMMSTFNPQAHSPTPPHLLSPAMQHRPTSASPHGSPAQFQGPFQVPSPRTHSRNASLDPSSAAYPQMHGWAGGAAFTNHRRVSSDARSDVSSSAHPSPYLANTESFDTSHSPLLHATNDPGLFTDLQLPLNQITLAEAQQAAYITPGQSPHISPHLPPTRQPLPAFSATDSFGLPAGLLPAMGGFNNGVVSGLEPFPAHTAPEAFSGLHQPANQSSPGQADMMSPPEFKIDLAPPSRQGSFEPPKPAELDLGGLTPPDRSRSRNRMRALSDPYVGGSSRGSTPSRDTLSPAAAGVGSRSPSPSGKSRRSSTSNVSPNRDYILDLADPNRPASTGEGGVGGNKRTQKHPATFQCSLCPKRFTRAYNLRSHLRTHTDERPFVCSVCGKAFARQHDRKRHESLHSGEKKFVCRGSLKNGGQWGCGRRFARADALGRHFRSEAGRICIKPLLEEEAQERLAQQGQSQANAGLPILGSSPGLGGPGLGAMPGQMFDAFGNPIGVGSGMDVNGMAMGTSQVPFRLPTALLAQYPTLGNIWDSLPLNPPDEFEHSGRSSFDASSAGEYEDADDLEQGGGAYSGWVSDVGV